jgi:hypothetical protein
MRFRKLMIGVSTLLFVTMITARPAAAVCTNASFVGVFGYFHGRPDGIGATVRAVVGQMTADGKGNLSGLWTMSLNGTITTGTFTGTYAIAKNCTGSMTFTSEDAAPAHFTIVLDDAHKGFQMIQTDSGFAQPGFGVAQGVVTCGLTGKKQTLATNFLGTIISSSEVVAVVGQVTLDGKGNISGFETASLGGTIATIPLTGTYTANANCTGTAQITPQGSSTGNFNVVVVNGGKELLLIETDSNTVITGTAQQ